jgi:hypothetical protein
MADLDTRLLRDDVKNSFKILNCSIDIYFDKTSYKTATYLYKYEIKKIGDAKDEWREVFAYQKKDFKVKYVTEGTEEPDNGDNGLLFKVSSLQNAAKNACLTLVFNKNLNIGDTYSFSYKCVTKIEGVSEISKIFGGNGVIWYWIANEYECDALDIYIHIPSHLTILNTHPDNTSIEKNSIHFQNRGLARNEFVSTIATYERKFLGLNPKYGKWIQILINMVIGALISIGLNLLLT